MNKDTVVTFGFQGAEDPKTTEKIESNRSATLANQLGNKVGIVTNVKPPGSQVANDVAQLDVAMSDTKPFQRLIIRRDRLLLIKRVDVPG